ncbi:MAG: response regulator receiver [Acidobacteria bacterium]|nr:response regulator receiver [Acidobacteriota bacterium]
MSDLATLAASTTYFLTAESRPIGARKIDAFLVSCSFLKGALSMRSVSTSRDRVVLLVEPHADTRAMYAEFFHHEGLPLTCVSDAAQALRVAPRAALIVTGLLLPGAVDGFALIARLRADAATARTPIIVVTACAWTSERVRAEQAGCDVFLAKPCLPDDLLAAVRRLLVPKRLQHVRGKAAKCRGGSTNAHRADGRKRGRH